MAFNATTGSASTPSPATGQTATATFNGSFVNDVSEAQPTYCWHGWGYGVGVISTFTSVITKNGNSGTFANTATVDSDRTVSRRAKIEDDWGNTKDGSILSFKTSAMAATAATPASSAVTITTATISCNYTPNTNESTASAQLQYRQFGTSEWINAGAAATGQTGYSQLSISRNLTGLTGGTTYQFRLVVTRTTANDTTLTSSTSSFTTSPATPSVTTNAANVVTSTGATLNATVNPNGFSTAVTFQYGTTNGGPYPTETSPATNLTGSGNQGVSKSITGLSASTTYYFRAKGAYSGGTIFGSQLSFTTAADPQAEAIEEDHVFTQDFNERIYGVQSTFYFPVASPAATSSDRFFNNTSPFASGDVKITKDGGTVANTTNLPARVGSTPVFSLTLTATEMQATTIVVAIVDQDGPAFRDMMLIIRTKQEVGQIVADATQLGSNNSGMTVTGVGASAGLTATGGATSAGDIAGVLGSHVVRVATAQAGGASTITLDANASATNDYYNNMTIHIISGTGTGQVRTISGYVGSSKVATVHRGWNANPASGSKFLIIPNEDPWNQAPDAELSAIPSATSTFKSLVLATFQRFFFKRTQSATTQTLFKADSSTSLGTASVADDGTIQTSGRVS